MNKEFKRMEYGLKYLHQTIFLSTDQWPRGLGNEPSSLA
jgi:hypothetical protein